MRPIPELLVGFVIAVSGCRAHAAGVLDRIIERQTIVVATNEDYAPQSFQDDSGHWTGFDVDMAREIASRLGVSAEFVTPPWELVVAGRWRGRWDIAINSMAPTESRAERLDFATAYYFAPVRAAVFDGDSGFETVDDLRGAVIGVCDGCSYQRYVGGELDILEEFAIASSFQLEAVQTRVYPDEWAAAESLGPRDRSEIDAVIAAEPTLQAMLGDEYPIRLLEGILFIEPLAIATEKGESALGARLEEIVRQMRSDGVIERLSRKWFGADYSRPASLQ